MSRVITFSRTFPSYHPRAGEPTHFVEKFWESLIQTEQISLSRCCELSRETGIGDITMNSIRKIKFEPKHHTIRAGHRFKVGDKFSPRVWSGKPYNSKQIIMAPDMEVKKTWDFYADKYRWIMPGRLPQNLEAISMNDGLSIVDFMDWFQLAPVKVFDGQIICWNDKIEY